MKKIFFYALAIASMLCGCDSGSVVEEGNKMTAEGFVGGLGNVTTSVSYYDFKEEDPGCKITGFSMTEGFGRWTDEEISTMTFGNVTPNSDLTAKIFMSMSTPSGEATKFEAYVGEKKVGYVESYPGIVYVNIPADAVGDADSLTLSFKMLNAKRPIDVDPNKYDSRLLGMGVKYVTLYGVSLDGEDDSED